VIGAEVIASVLSIAHKGRLKCVYWHVKRNSDKEDSSRLPFLFGLSLIQRKRSSIFSDYYFEAHIT